MESIGDRVRRLREERGMKPADLARAIGVKQPSLFYIESGRTKALRGNTLTRLCEELRTTADFLLYGNESTAGLELAVMEAELTYILRVLTPERRLALIEYARFLVAQQPGAQLPKPGTDSTEIVKIPRRPKK